MDTGAPMDATESVKVSHVIYFYFLLNYDAAY